MLQEDSPRPIYLDHAATTPLSPAALEAMLPYLAAEYGNASSIHSWGRRARIALDNARVQVAALVGAQPEAIVFTSCGTESINLALTGVMECAPAGRNALVVTAIEHHAVLHTAQALSRTGVPVTVADVDSHGSVDPHALRECCTENTALVSVMHANNEIGTVQPVEEIAAAAHGLGALVHVDAVQSAGILDLDVDRMGCDLLSLSAHKLYGPKGAGALYIRPGVAVAPLLHGGAQEREKRAGTENVAAIVGFGAAAEEARRMAADERHRQTELRDRLRHLLTTGAPGIRLNGHPDRCLPGIVNVSVENVDGALLVVSLDRKGIAVSSGSACSSGSVEPSHVLRAIGSPEELAAAAVRFSLGRGTTVSDVDEAAEAFSDTVKQLRRVK